MMVFGHDLAIKNGNKTLICQNECPNLPWILALSSGTLSKSPYPLSGLGGRDAGKIETNHVIICEYTYILLVP